MKKAYVKPEVYFENFQLSASIAAGCTLISNSAENLCPVADKDLGVTYITDNACTYTTPGENDQICYHNPSDQTKVFTS